VAPNRWAGLRYSVVLQHTKPDAGNRRRESVDLWANFPLRRAVIARRAGTTSAV